MKSVVLLAAWMVLLPGCHETLGPAALDVTESPLSLKARPAPEGEDRARHIAPIVTRLDVRPTPDGIRFAARFKHRYPGDHQHYNPYVAGGFEIIVSIDPMPPYDVSGGSNRMIWGLPDPAGLRLSETSLYGTQPRGLIAVEIRPHFIEFTVPYEALRDDDGLVDYKLRVLAITAVGPSGPVAELVDTYSGSTLPGL